MSEKKVEESTIGEQNVDYGTGHMRTSHTASRRKSSAVDPAVIAGEIFDERYETTHRGLKSRLVNLF
jgi:amino acid transporter